MSTKVPIIYIAGSSHSGSTILDLLLGSHSSVESLGEAKKIPEILSRMARGEKPICTCRQELVCCPLWSGLLTDQLANIDRDDEANALLCRRALRQGGKSVILDSSKTLGRAMLFARSERFDAIFVHLVRDSRAVVFSSQRKKDRNPVGRYGLIETAREWRKLNSRIGRRLRSRSQSRVLLVRYEDLTADPGRTLSRILQAAGLAWEPAMLRFREHPHHNIEGNRMRMDTNTEIKRDEEYLRALDPAKWALATLLTWRGLREFGYPLKRSPVVPATGAEVPSLR